MNKWLAALCAMLFIVSPLEADTYNWTGGGGASNWAIPGNWSGGSSYPQDGDTANISFGTVSNVPAPNYAFGGLGDNIYIYNGNLNVSGGMVEIQGTPALTAFGVGNGNKATITQTGGTIVFDPMKPHSLYIGGHSTFPSNASTKGTYDQIAGVFENLYGTVYVGANGATGQWTIAAAATAASWETSVGNDGIGALTIDGGGFTNTTSLRMGGGTSGVGVLTLNSGTVSIGTQLYLGSNSGTGTLDMFGGTINAKYLEISRNGNGTANIWGGNLNISEDMGALGLIQNDSTLNIYGTKAKISTKTFGSDFDDATRKDLNTNFYLDRHGVTTIDVSTFADVNKTISINPGGSFMSLGVDHIDLVSAATLDGYSIVNANNTTGYIFKKEYGTDFGKKQLRYSIDTDPSKMETWDLLGEFRFDEGKEKGYMKVAGRETELLLIWENPDDSYSQLLLDYLNSGILDTGAKFFLNECGKITMAGGYLNNDGYAFFGWDLTDYNMQYGTNTKLLGFNEVPEPATWSLLMAGFAICVMASQKNRKSKQA